MDKSKHPDLTSPRPPHLNDSRQNSADKAPFVAALLFLAFLLPQNIAKLASILVLTIYFCQKRFFFVADWQVLRTLLLTGIVGAGLLTISILWQGLFAILSNGFLAGQFLSQGQSLTLLKAQLLALPWFETLALLVLSVIYEEFVFRVFILETLGQIRVATMIAVALAALAFALLHSQLGLHGVGLAFFSGIFLGAVWYRFRNIVSLMLGHLLYNLIILYN